jgi:hypothetical protein
VYDIACTSAGDSQGPIGFMCNDGFYPQDNAAPTADVCLPCTTITNSNNVGLTCSSAMDSQVTQPGFACDNGYYLVDNAAPTADTCNKCPGIPNSNNVNITCGDGGLDPIGDPNNGFECNVGYRKNYSTTTTILNSAVVSCIKCPDILNSNNVALACEEFGVCDHQTESRTYGERW